MSTDPHAFTADAILADSAASAEGKLYVQGGGWSQLNSPSFPFKQNRIGLGIVVGVPWTETNKNHKLEITLEGDDGPIPLSKQIGPDGEPAEVTGVGAQFNIGRPPNVFAGDRQNVGMALNFDGLIFNKPGGYCFTVKINDEEINRLGFRVAGPPMITVNL